MPSLGGVETPNADPSKDSPRDSHTLQYIMASCYPITLKFIDVCYRLKLEKRSAGNNITKMLTGGGGPTRSTDTITERTILNGITGKVSPGEILAVLGPSGSGKSTLLNALAGRLQGQGFSGSVLANNRKLTKPVLKRTGFVTQDDVLYPHLTVRETLVFCSLLRLPNTLSKKEKITMAESVMSELGLTKCENTIIGNSFIRGVSGGERKRVSIAHEMLINPSLLILDEPTSGLDSTAAYRLVERMGEMAEKGRRTVVMSVHQPSSRVYRMFESVLVMSEGRCIYFGKGSEAMTYFHSLGFSPSFPMNPADFLLDLANEVLQGDSTKGDVKASLTVKANEDGHDWLFASVIIRFNSEFSIISIRSALKDIGLDQVVVRQGGGRDAILTFKSKEELQSSLQKIKDWFKEWSLFVLEWKPGIQIDQERCVWLKCHGIPLNLWNMSNLNNIGALWGTVLQLEGDLSQPKSFTYSRIKVATTCMELITKTILLECKGKLHSVFVCEDHCVDPAECNGVRNIGLADCISSSKVEFSRAEENDCKGKDGVGLVAKQFVLDDAVMPSSIEVVHRKELSHCNSREVVDTAVEETRCDVEVSRPTALGGKKAMMEECAPCPKRVDLSLRCVEHAVETGVFKNFSGSVDGFGPGINLEVVLGSPNIEQTVQGPIRKPCLQQGNRGMSLHDQGPVHCPAPFLNPIRSAKKAGKKKVQLEGFSRFARLYGHQSAAIGRLPSKSVIFRPAAVALAHSELSESESSTRSYLLKEAQATVKLGKELGIDFGGQEESVVDKILEMERKDKESYLKDGIA